METSIDLTPAAENPAGEPVWDFHELSLRKMGHKSRYLFWRRHPQRRLRLPADSICHTEWRHTVLSRPNYRAEQHRASTNLLRQQLHQVSESAGLNTCSAQIHSSNEPSSSENVKKSSFFCPDAVGTQICLAIYRLRHSGGSIAPPSILYGPAPAGYRLLTLAEGHFMATRCLTASPACGHIPEWTMVFTVQNSESSNQQLKSAHVFIVAAAAQRFPLFCHILSLGRSFLRDKLISNAGQRRKKNTAGHLVC